MVKAQQTMAHLNDEYQALTLASAKRQFLLVEKLSWHEFRRDVLDAQAWVVEGLQFWSHEDIGLNQDDCEVLLKKCEDLAQDVTVSEGARIIKVQQHAKELQQANHGESDGIHELQKSLAARWQQLRALITTRLGQLTGALIIHRCKESTAQLTEIIHGKNALALATKVANNLMDAEAHRRHFDLFMLSLIPLAPQVDLLVTEITALLPGAGVEASPLQQQREQLITSHHQLVTLSDQRKRMLGDAVDLQRFLTRCRSVQSWAESLTLRLSTPILPSDSRSTVLLLEHYKSCQVEFAAYAEPNATVMAMGTALVQRIPWGETEITHSLGLQPALAFFPCFL